MDAMGIQSMIVSDARALMGSCVEGNVQLEERAAQYGSRFLGYLTFNPLYGAALTARFEDFFSREFFVGFKTLCDYWQTPITDERFVPMFEYANKHRLPILSHTWEGTCDRPGMFTEIVQRYPDAAFILGHSGGGDAGRREAEQLALTSPNVHLEWCGSFCSSIPWEETLDKVGTDRVVFGTDAIFHDFAWELGRFLSLDLPFDVIRPILGENMTRILESRR